MKMAIGTLKSRFPYRHLTDDITIPPLATIAVVFNILVIIFALRWTQQPFLGIFFNPDMVVVSHSTVNGTELQNGAILSSVEGQPVSSGRELYHIIQQKQTGENISLGINGEAVSVPLTTFPISSLFLFFLLPYIIGLIYIWAGFTVYFLYSVGPASKKFVIFCSLTSMAMGGIFDFYTLHLLTPIWLIILPFAGSSLLDMAFVFPVKTRLTYLKPYVRYVPYLLALILGLINLYILYFTDSLSTILAWNVGFIGLNVVLFLLLLQNSLSSISLQVRQQSSLVLRAAIISFAPAAIWTVATILGNDISLLSGFAPVAIIGFMAIFPFSIAYATLRYLQIDMEVIFSRVVVYTLLTLFVTVGYIIIITLLGFLLHDTEFYTNPVILAIFIASLVIFLEPIREQTQKLVDRLFMREKIDSPKLVRRYGQYLVAAPMDVEFVVKTLLEQVNEAFSPEHILIFLKDNIQDVFTVMARDENSTIEDIKIEFALDDDLIRWLTNNNKALQFDSEGIPLNKVNISREELARLSMLGIVLCVPMMGADSLLGWLSLGLKKSARPYLSDDLFLLDTLANKTTIALENIQLLEQANRRAAELEALQKISGEIRAETDMDNLLTSVVRQAAHLLNAEGGMVFLLQPDGETLQVVVSYNLDKDYLGFTLTVGEDVAGQVMRQDKPLVANGYKKFHSRSDKFSKADFGAVLGVPLHWGGQVRGVLQLTHFSDELRFSDDDVWLMESFATQSAIALEKSQLLKDATKQASQLSILSEVSIAISSTLNLDTALQRVMERAVQILSAEAGSLFLMDARGKELTFEVVLGPTGSNLLGLKVPIGKGIVGTVAETSKPLIINDVAKDPRWNISFDEATEFQTKDIICVPMVTREQVVGVIELINKQDGTVFNQDDSNLLLSFASQAAIAIENAQLFTRTDLALAGRVQELQTLQMFDYELQNSLELEKVMEISITRMMDALGISIGVIGIIETREEGEGLYLLAQHGMPTEMGRYKIDPWPLNKGIMGRVAREGELVWLNDISSDKDYIPKNHRSRSILIIPISREDRVIGVLDLESTDLDYFTSDDVAFIKLLTSHAAIAIENAQLFEKVRIANNAKTEFMSTASHELKIPMTSIKGYAKLLAMGAGGKMNDQQKEFLAVITNNVDRMSGMVNDLLDVSRIESGRIRLEIEDVRMRDVVDDVIRSVNTQIKNKKLNLTIDIADDLPDLRADYNRMIQIMTNLVSNAYKYTPIGGDITITIVLYNNDMEGLAISVKDTGYGISEEDQTKLFNTFFRSSNQDIRNEPGTGLGLSITKKMIETHGGELTFESELGKGTTFTFTTPLISEIPPGVEVVER